MCAAKLERTGYVFRTVWPNVKQHTNESGFVRRNSHKAAVGIHRAAEVEAAAVASVNVASRGCGHSPQHTQSIAAIADASTTTTSTGSPLLATPQARRHQPSRMRHHAVGSTRRFAAQLLRGVPASAHQQQARRLAASVVSVAEQRPVGGAPGLTAALLQQHKQPRHDPVLSAVPTLAPAKSGVTIDELLQTASEKYELNRDFWGQYADIPAMAKATQKGDILQIVENFALIHRKHIYLFQSLKTTILANLEPWSAADLAALCHSWAQLGFLHEDLCVAMASRVTATAGNCNTQELCWLMDAYATARCSIQSVTDEIIMQTLFRIEDFSNQQLCLHASSFARLNIHHSRLLELIAARLVQVLPPPHAIVEIGSEASKRAGAEPESGIATVASTIPAEPPLTARDITLASYAFAKLGFCPPDLFAALARGGLGVIRDLTARDLQMLIAAFARAQHRSDDLLAAFSLQAQRRIAQFNAESLALTLRSVAFFGLRDPVLFTRVVAQLPRAISTFRPVDVTTLLGAFAATQVHSEAFFDVVTPFILEKASMFTPSDWVGALRGYSSLGHRDATFLSAFALHLNASQLSLRQLCAAIVDCSRLSFAGSSASLVEAVAMKGFADEVDIPLNVAAQMYSALLLLGHSTGAATTGVVQDFLRLLAGRLENGASVEQLPLTTCVNLCVATLLAPPVASSTGGSLGKHPVDVATLVDRCSAEAEALSNEEVAMLRLVARTLEMLPWNRCALINAHKLEALPAPVPQAASAKVDTVAAPGGHAAADVVASCDGWVTLEASGDLPEPFYAGIWSQLAPHHVECRGRPPPSGGNAEIPLQEFQNRVPLQQQHHQQQDQQHQQRQRSQPAIAWQGVYAARELFVGLQSISVALKMCGVEHRLVLQPGTEAHILVRRSAVVEASGASCFATSSAAAGTGPAASTELAVLWGSALHYVSDLAREKPTGARTSAIDPRAKAPSTEEAAAPATAETALTLPSARYLTPAARLQVASLQAERGIEVVLVPHWWWPRNVSPEHQGRALGRLLAASPEARRRLFMSFAAKDSEMSPNLRSE